ncbi:MAG: LytTR family DNA-binding domain-containing protein [Melioribacteraceae bacterium]|nr:LytTR family DNA-binding domain-containing protein [Melioribacteraceae bacterium]MCF8354188.1 LytTR family DNA-binding domain-containing protein [Melioribacteraceae bacterium]MCF8394726.1 LytTR family DNA-binding domain-containing protein [Melioribacteraceae bacterium]MCF8418111.1 LytTR family DNA-binding domain-containing protein [Melioribacteraceae bacterium]
MYKILIIDDDASIRDNLKDIFELSGYNVNSAEDGIEGIKKAKEIIPDLILCDIAMPDLDGYKVKMNLETDKNTSLIPFIFLTAKADFKNMRHAMNLGADDYITKPVRSRDLLEIVKKRLERISSFKSQQVNSNSLQKLSLDDKILVSDGSEHVFVMIGNIVVIKVTGDYTKIYINDRRKIIVKRTLKSWEKVLPKNNFLRVRRNIILNINFVEKLEPWFKGIIVAKIYHYPEVLKFSKRYSMKFKKSLKNNPLFTAE